MLLNVLSSVVDPDPVGPDVFTGRIRNDFKGRNRIRSEAFRIHYRYGTVHVTCTVQSYFCVGVIVYSVLL